MQGSQVGHSSSGALSTSLIFKLSKAENNSSLYCSILVIVIFFVVYSILYYFFGEGDIIPVVITCCILMFISIISIIRGHKGKYVLKKNRDYSFDKENLLCFLMGPYITDTNYSDNDKENIEKYPKYIFA